MDDLPELPFEKVLSYLSLRDRLRLSAVSRSCHQKIVNSRVRSLCYSSRPIGFIHGKSRWVSGPLAENFISSIRFASFFNTYGQTILSSLKHLRLCDLDLSATNETAFGRTLSSFGQLEELDIIRAQCGSQRQCKLNLPMLTSLHLEEVKMSRKLILDAPRLRTVRAMDCYDLRVEIVHGESVESLITSSLRFVEVKKLKNLKYLYVNYFLNEVDSTFLSSLEQLKEVHLIFSSGVSELFEQKRRYDRADLKIYLCGLLQIGPDDQNDPPLRDFFGYPKDLSYLIENPSKVADVIPLYRDLFYFSIDYVSPEVPIDDLMNRFTGLNSLLINQRVQNNERFLDLLKNFQNIVELRFEGTHSQDLFDRLPEYCAVQKLRIWVEPSDLGFLFRLKHLIHLDLNWPVDDVELVRKAFEKLPFLSFFRCHNDTIEVSHPKQFKVSTNLRKTVTVSDLNAVIQFIVENKRQKKRKVDESE